jgi:hypothetical protein
LAGRLSRADNPNSFFVIRIGVGVNDDEQDDFADEADRVPSLFSALKPVGENDMQRVIPDARGQLETDAVLGKIRLRLRGVPLEFQYLVLIYRIVHTISCVDNLRAADATKRDGRAISIGEPELADEEKDAVKRIARELLEKLKSDKLVLDWRLKERAKAAVRTTIQQSLDALPPAYEDAIWNDKVGRTYQWIFERY